MEMEDIQVALTSSNSLLDFNEEYTFEHPYSQRFSLPYPIIKHILKYPTPKAWKKLLQTCKYFYSKKAVYPVQCLKRDRNGKYVADGESFDSNKAVAKLWLYDELYVNTALISPTAIQKLIPKIHGCTLQTMEMSEQFLTLDQYQLLTSSGNIKRLNLMDCKFPNITFDRLIQNLHQLEHLKMRFNSTVLFEPDTTAKTIQIFESMKKLRSLYLRDLPESFDLTVFKDFVMRNKTVHICLYYSIARERLPERLVKFIDAIIETPPAKVPFIEFPGFRYGSVDAKYEKYQRIYKREKL